MSFPQLIGWSSSALLVLTIGSQLLHQWREGSVHGVSPLLFVGQCLASLGLLVFSVLQDQIVFVVLNAIMAMAALVGLGMWFVFHRRELHESSRESSGHAVPTLHTSRGPQGARGGI